ncbi:12_t:CDS:2 [Acaulospora colombiana]|uniref:12_t:CDS:1 n=1 Tax=Acaulospora colombiana TaxID=27376 RepID=A0ACA9K6P7_9GLOM|nr:12_t:CDS:2 [Acaulospora colombiana]
MDRLVNDFKFEFYPNWQNLSIDTRKHCHYSDETKCVTLYFAANGYPLTEFNFVGQSIFYIHKRDNALKIGYSIGNVKWPCDEFLEDSEHEKDKSEEKPEEIG